MSAFPLACSLHQPLAPHQPLAATPARRPARAARFTVSPQAQATVASATATLASPAQLLTTSTPQAVHDYNRDMAARMGWTHMDNPFQYRFEGPLYYHYISSDLIVGAQPRNAADVDHLAQEGVDVILNLQQDKDMAYWKVSVEEIANRAAHHGMQLVRTPAVDFSPHSLRDALPRAVRELQKARAAGRKVYVHCTAGLGRSPAVAIAALYWCSDLQLDEAYSFLTSIRPCGPSKDAIRGATYDLLSGRPQEQFQYEAAHGFATLSAHDRQAIRAKLGLA